MDKLKPCPFCGGEAKVMDMGYPHWVYCTKCYAKVHGGTTDEKDSIEAWNKRVLPAQDVPDTNVGDTVSRQAAIDCFWTKDRHFRDALDVIKDIRQLPPAQPEIVRCKDCKYYCSMNRETKTGICNLTIHQNFSDDWFCAGAERRTDERPKNDREDHRIPEADS